jgi:hypothetical protein
MPWPYSEPPPQPSSLTAILQNLFSASTIDAVHEHVTHPSSVLLLLKRQALSSLAMVSPLFQPAIDAASRFAYEQPAAVAVASFVAILALVFVVLNWVRRVVMWWARITARLAFIALAVAVASGVYQRGIMACARDAVVVGAKIVGYLAVVKDVFLAEYERYDAQSRQPQYVQQTRGGRHR